MAALDYLRRAGLAVDLDGERLRVAPANRIIAAGPLYLFTRSGLEPPRPMQTTALADKQAMDSALQRALANAEEVRKRMAGRAERLGLKLDEATGDD